MEVDEEEDEKSGTEYEPDAQSKTSSDSESTVHMARQDDHGLSTEELFEIQHDNHADETDFIVLADQELAKSQKLLKG